MPREKIERKIEQEYHEYSEEEKKILIELREKAKFLLLKLENNNLNAFVHGSVARGDIGPSSDVDIYIPTQIPSYRIDVLDEFDNANRHIVVGTPNSTIKALLTMQNKTTISFPLSSPKEREIEFFRFSGLSYLDDLTQDRRVPGVNKKLLLIEPEGEGYWISSIRANIKKALDVLSVSQRIIDERIRVLERRDTVGRTGVFLNYTLAPGENFDQAIKKLADRNVIIRKIIRNR